MQEVADDQRFVNVKLELAIHATNSGRNVVAHNLGTDHSQSLTLRGVNFSRHDAAARLVFGQVELTKATARATAEVSNILSDLGQRGSKGVKRAVGLDNSVMGSQGLKLVRGSLELGASHVGDLLSNSLGEALESVDARANGGAALGEETQIRERALYTLDAKVELSNVTRELLGES